MHSLMELFLFRVLGYYASHEGLHCAGHLEPPYCVRLLARTLRIENEARTRPAYCRTDPPSIGDG
jgi:hypothetical protein